MTGARIRSRPSPQTDRTAGLVDIRCSRGFELPALSRFRRAAREVTEPQTAAAPAPGRGGGGRGAAFPTTRSLAADYLALCQHPLRDLRRWLAEGRSGQESIAKCNQSTERKGGHGHPRQQSFRASARKLCHDPLSTMRRGLDADRQGWRHPDRVFVGSREGVARNVELRSVRAEARGLGRPIHGLLAAEPFASFQGEQAALRALYGAKIEATRRSSTHARDLGAALRSLFDERHAAMQELANRRRAFKASMRERRKETTAGRREEERRARPS